VTTNRPVTPRVAAMLQRDPARFETIPSAPIARTCSDRLNPAADDVIAVDQARATGIA
jgi:hypothetical protein